MPAHFNMHKPALHSSSHYRTWNEIKAEILSIADEMDIPVDHAMRYVLEQDRINFDNLA